MLLTTSAMAFATESSCATGTYGFSFDFPVNSVKKRSAGFNDTMSIQQAEVSHVVLSGFFEPASRTSLKAYIGC